MPSPENDDASSTTTSQPEYHQHQSTVRDVGMERVMEAVVRTTFAGLGGSIVGLAQEKHMESVRVVTGAAATAQARRMRSPKSTMMNLPVTWALSCMTFCAIVESSRLLSPSRLIFETMKTQGMIESKNTTIQSTSSIHTIVDYSVGGGLAGWFGSFVRRTQLSRKLPQHILRGSPALLGLGPGMALGVAAGFLQSSTDYGIRYFEDASRSSDKTLS